MPLTNQQYDRLMHEYDERRMNSKRRLDLRTEKVCSAIPEIKEIEEKYAQAALRAKKAGFDGVEIHSVGYYLGQQFLSKTANIRTDEYGGSRENRMRFHLNIIRRIRELCGKDFVIN